MNPVDFEEQATDLPLEDDQPSDTPNYRVTFGTFTILAPSPTIGE